MKRRTVWPIQRLPNCFRPTATAAVKVAPWDTAWTAATESRTPSRTGPAHCECEQSKDLSCAGARNFRFIWWQREETHTTYTNAHTWRDTCTHSHVLRTVRFSVEFPIAPIKHGYISLHKQYSWCEVLYMFVCFCICVQANTYLCRNTLIACP